MKVFKCGEQVKMKVGGGYGMITASINRFDSIRYEITKHDGEIVNKHEDEFLTQANKVEIGFKRK